LNATPTALGGVDSIDDIPPAFSEESIAIAFSNRHAHEWRYVAAWGRWYHWNGLVWSEEKTLKAIDLSRKLCREFARKLRQQDEKKARAAAAIASKSTVMAVESLARADRRSAATIEEWDRDLWILNTPGGVVNLRTGNLRKCDPDDRCTKITAVAPGGKCDLWLRFLDQVTDRNDELIAYLQRAFGYALTGSTREHALLFFYGTGANGKSTLLNAITGILNTYATVAPPETFAETQGERHPADLAMLRGARLVTSIETEDGRRWASARIKSMTGGDPIAARFMRQDFFFFTPQFQLIIAGNHKPGLKNVDEAIRRRMHLVPFVLTIPAADRDNNLSLKLREEWGGILEWMVQGCLAWQREGLAPPSVVREATEAYLIDEDVLGLWLSECTQKEPNAFAATSELHDSYQKWAERAGERFLGTKRFTQALEERGLHRGRVRGEKDVRGFNGLKIKDKDKLL